MSLKLLMDEHVPKDITTELQARGVDVTTTQDIGARHIDDVELIRRTTALGRVLFTQDNGFARHVIGFYEREEDFSGVILAPQNFGIGPTVKGLYLVAEVMEPDEMRNTFRRLTEQLRAHL